MSTVTDLLNRDPLGQFKSVEHIKLCMFFVIIFSKTDHCLWPSKISMFGNVATISHLMPQERLNSLGCGWSLATIRANFKVRVGSVSDVLYQAGQVFIGVKD